MNFDKDYLMKKSKNFCMAPWIHMHIMPNGETFPCCIAETDDCKGVGNFNNMTVKELWNSEKMKGLRLNMLNDKPTKMCRKCYEFESSGNVWTLRNELTRMFSEKYYRVEQTHEDGSHDDPQFYYWDIRFNNLCNLKCRTCGPEFSTSWWQDYEYLKDKQKGPLIGVTEKPTFWEEIRPLVDNIELVYFAGGEPLITDEHYKLLDIWLEQNKQETIKIGYTTNFTKLIHKGKNVLDYWAKFKVVNVIASLDASHKRAEWLRKGTKWKKIIQNRKDMIEAIPECNFGITPTISAYNIWHLPDFFKEWLELEFIKPWDIKINLLADPLYMQTRVLPTDFKKEVEEKWLKYFDWLRESGYKKEDNEEMWTYLQYVIKYMWEDDKSDQIPELLKNTRRWDNVRNENMFDIFPELKILEKYDQ
jgi:radical SAM protein with 4Fe4S-binding SPASM domain